MGSALTADDSDDSLIQLQGMSGSLQFDDRDARRDAATGEFEAEGGDCELPESDSDDDHEELSENSSDEGETEAGEAAAESSEGESSEEGGVHLLRSGCARKLARAPCAPARVANPSVC